MLSSSQNYILLLFITNKVIVRKLIWEVEKVRGQYLAGILTFENFLKKEAEIYLAEGKLQDIYQKYYSKIPFEDFTTIISADPTTPVRDNEVQKPGKFSKWLLDIYMKGNLRLEDLYRATEYLDLFMRHQKKLEISQRNINSYDSLQKLASALELFKGTKTQSQVSDEAKKDADKVFENANWLVVVPKTKEASCYYGKGTEWCTASTANDYKHNRFDDYSDLGKLYININKKEGRKYQFHFSGNEFMNENDESINLLEILNTDPELLEFYWINEIKDSNEPSDIRELSDGGAEYLAWNFDDLIDSEIVTTGDSDEEWVKSLLKGDGYHSSGEVTIRFDPHYNADDIDNDNANSIRKILTQATQDGEYVWDDDLEWDDDEDVVKFAYENDLETQSILDIINSSVYALTAESEAYTSITTQLKSHFGLSSVEYEEVRDYFYDKEGVKHETTKTLFKYKISPEDYKKIKISLFQPELEEDITRALSACQNGFDDIELDINIPRYGWEGEWDKAVFNEELANWFQNFYRSSRN